MRQSQRERERKISLGFNVKFPSKIFIEHIIICLVLLRYFIFKFKLVLIEFSISILAIPRLLYS